MPANITLKRPDGTLIEVSPEQAKKLAILGYTPETPEEETFRAVQAAHADSYQDAESKVTAFFEGANRGLTFGLSDALAPHLPGYTPGAAQRAENNPGIAMGSEIMGSIAPVLLTGGTGAVAKAAGALPSARLAAAVESATAGMEAGVVRSATRGALEGGVYGAAQSVDRAVLNGDPVTAEGVLHGLGWGTLFGGGLGAVGGAIESKAVKAAEAIKREPAAVQAASRAEWGAFSDEMGNLRSTIRATTDRADDVLTAGKAAFREAAEASGMGSFSAQQVWEKLENSYTGVVKATTKGKAEAIDMAIAEFTDVSKQMGEALGHEAPEAVKAIKDLAALHAAQAHLSTFPKSIEAFAAMKPAKAERMFAALEAAEKTGRFPEISEGLKQSTRSFSEKIGITGDSTLRAVYDSFKQADKAEKGGPGFVRKAASWVAGAKAYGLGAAVGGPIAGVVTAGAARRVVRDGLTGSLVAAKSSALARINKAVAQWQPAGKALKMIAPRVADPLAVRLDGTLDSEKKSRQALAAARIKEIYSAAPNINDRIFAAIEPISVEQPELAPALMKSMVSAFQSMLEILPKDPGVVSGLSSIWKPSPIQSEVLARQLEVFHSPIAAVEQMLASGQFDPIACKMLEKVAPALYQEMKISAWENICTPEKMGKTSYHEQVGLSFLGLPVHSSMQPEFIATSLQMFQKRNQPLPTPNVAPSDSGGRPAAANNMATNAARIEQH